MALSEAELARRARRAYERGRLRRAIVRAWPACAYVGLVSVIGQPTIVAVVLVAAVIVLAHRGRGLDWGNNLGLLAGAIPAVAALATRGGSCGIAQCSPLCIPACASAGLVMGVWLGARLGRSHRPAPPVLAVATLAAAAGCLPIGLGALLGVVVGLTLGVAPAWLATSSPPRA